MRALHPLIILAVLVGSPLFAENLPPGVSRGIIPPENLGALGEMMTDRAVEMVTEDIAPGAVPETGTRSLDLFAADADEDPNLREIRRLARELETQRSMILQLVELQEDLIDFAVADPVAAYRSRIPVSVCLHGIDPIACEHLDGTFQ